MTPIFLPNAIYKNFQGVLIKSIHISLKSVSHFVINGETMKIVLDLHWLKPGWTGGIETLAYGFLNVLARHETHHRFVILAPLEAMVHRRLPFHPGFEWVPVDAPGLTLRRLRGQPRFSDIRADVGLAFCGYIQPELMHLPFVVIVPDLQHDALPHFFPLTERIERQYLFTKAIRNAVHCITLSQYTRQFLLERYQLMPDRVSVVYPGVSAQFLTQSLTPSSVQAILDHYGLLRGDYFYYPAHTWPHKNHRILLQALARIRQDRQLVPLLVCSGQPKNAHDTFLHTIRSLALNDRVRWLGYLPDEVVPALYAGALALVFPSKYEGFGFPILEAMAMGCPVLCSRVTSLPEIAGDAARFLDPDDAEAWAEALVELMDHPEQREVMIRKGRDRVQEFSWEQFMTDVLAILERIGHREPCSGAGRIEQQGKGSFTWDERWRWVWRGYLRIRAWGQKIYQGLKKRWDALRVVQAQTRRLMEHQEPWWDGWVGPVMVLSHKLEHPADHLIIRGEHDPPHPGESLSLAVYLDGERVAIHQVDKAGVFDLTIPLSRVLEPGVHIVTIKAHPWWIAHRRWRNRDFRPLAWRLKKMEFVMQDKNPKITALLT